MTKLRIETLIILQAFTALHFLLVRLIDYPLGYWWIWGHQLCHWWWRDLNNVSIAILIGPFLIFLPSSAINIAHLCLFLKMARFRPLSWNFKLLWLLSGVHLVIDLEFLLIWWLSEIRSVVIDDGIFVLKSFLSSLWIQHLVLSPFVEVLLFRTDLDIAWL